MNHYDLQQRSIIIDALFAIKDIPGDQWMPQGFYDPETGCSDLMGWYVRTKFDPVLDDHCNWYVLAAPLSHAINSLISYCITPDQDVMDAYMICAGKHPVFQQSTPRERSMACLQMIVDCCCVDVPPLHHKFPPPPQHVEMRS